MLKNLFKGFLFFILALITVRCTSDLPEPDIPMSRTETVSIHEVPGLLEAIAPYVNPSFLDRGNISSAYQGDTYFGMKIDFEKIQAQMDSMQYTNYSFLLDDGDGDKNTFANLVVGKDSLGQYRAPLLLEYEMNPDFASQYYQTGSLQGFVGKIKKSVLLLMNSESQRLSRSTGGSEEPDDYGGDRDQPSTTCPEETVFNGNETGDPPAPSGVTVSMTICEKVLHWGYRYNSQGEPEPFMYITYENCRTVSAEMSSSDSNPCETPEGEIPVNGPSDPDKPCPKNPVKDPEVAPQTNSGMKGGMWGKFRDSGNTWHYGVDIKADYDDAIYAMYDGSIYSAKYQEEGAGYYTRIQSTVNGETFLVEYHHLQKDNRVTTGSVKAGDIIGYLGDSGNLKNAISQGLAESHVHISVREHDGSNLWGFSHYSLVDPLSYLATEIDSNGVVTKNADCD